jgi:hypothetical protein
MKNEMPSTLLNEKNMHYYVTSRYTAKFLGGQYRNMKIMSSLRASPRMKSKRKMKSNEKFLFWINLQDGC